MPLGEIMAQSDDNWWTVIIVVGLMGFAVYSCSKDKSESAPPIPETAISTSVTDTTETGLAAAADSISLPKPMPAPVPAPYYDVAENGVYYYVGVPSPEARQKGSVSGNTIGFQYLGRNDLGEHILQRVVNGVPAWKSACANPCNLIKHDNGDRQVYNPDSIIGGAYRDAIMGFMKPKKVYPPRTQKQEPAQVETSEKLSNPIDEMKPAQTDIEPSTEQTSE
jgi:hypothetical protein